MFIINYVNIECNIHKHSYTTLLTTSTFLNPYVQSNTSFFYSSGASKVEYNLINNLRYLNKNRNLFQSLDRGRYAYV